MNKISLVEEKGDHMKNGLRMFGIGLVGLIVAITLGGCERGCGAKGHAPDYFLKKVDREVKELNLTQAQQAKYEDIRHRLEADMNKHMDKMKQLHSEIEKNFKSEHPDVNTMAAQLKKDFTEEGDPRQKLIDYFVEFYNILDQNQQKQVDKYISKKIGSMNKRCLTGKLF
jgi:Spy/CpxP family protein refolding chaperone